MSMVMKPVSFMECDPYSLPKKKKAKVYSSDSDVLRELWIFIIKTFGGVIFFFFNTLLLPD